MFNKAYKIKSHTQLKSSDRKRVRQELLQSFPKIIDVVDEIIPIKENVSVMKIVTHKNIIVNVYTLGKFPLYFIYENVNYPSCYLMWKFFEKTKQDLIPTFITHEGVVPKLLTGADLMLPGVVGKISSDIHVGNPVAISTSENRSTVAIGKAVKSYQDLQTLQTQDGRGKCVEIFHTYADHLTDGFPRPQFLNEQSEITEICTQLNNIECKEVLDENEADKHELINDDETLNKETNGEESENCKTLSESNEIATKLLVEEIQLSPQEEMDNLLKYSLLKSIKLAGNKLKLPVLVSTFYKTNVLEACPENYSIDIKKSSYKKLSLFLKSMAEENLIKLREEVKGIENITEINYNHPLIKTFQRWPDDCEENIEQTVQERAPEIAELYKINAAVLQLFTPFHFKKGDELTAPVVKKCLTDYVKIKGLQDVNNPSLICCDSVINSALNCGYQEKISWENYIKGCTGKLTLKYHLTARGPQTKTSVGTGKLQPIDISVSMRSGNKKVTLVNNLELFGIVCQEFARKCQHGVAASTSISEVPGRKTPQVLVQGNQVEFVGKLLLDEYKIPLRYIRGYDNLPKKKKKPSK